MALIVPKWGFKYHASRWTQNGVTALGAGVTGATITAGAANTKGSTSTVLTVVDFDVHCIAIAASGNNSSGAVKSGLLDVMHDPAGGTSWATTPLVSNLLFGQEIGLGSTASHQHIYIFPLYVKSGASFGAKWQSSTASSTILVHMWLWGEPTRPEMWWCGGAVETLGANTGTSTGVTLTPGNGGWTATASTIGTSTRPYGAYQLGVGTNDVYTVDRNVVFMQPVASTGSTQKIGTNYYFTNVTSTETMVYGTPAVPNFCDIPSGTVFYATGWAASNATDTWALTHYGVY